MEPWKQRLLPLMPAAVASVLSSVPDDAPLLEIRIRQDRPLELVFDGYDRIVYGADARPMTDRAACERLLARFTEHSRYAWENELTNGFITLGGGYRVGLAGRMQRANGTPTRFSSVTGFCIRIAREVKGAAIPLAPWLNENGALCSTLLVGQPGSGKTTVLRDLIRLASDGLCGFTPCRVAVADERFELCGADDGGTAFDLGARTDVLAGIKKADAMQRLIAALSPQVLATDELNETADIDALLRARGCGVTVVATAHGRGMEELAMRKALHRLAKERVFFRIVLLEGRGCVRAVLDGDGQALKTAEESP